MAPTYLGELLCVHSSCHCLRLNAQGNLTLHQPIVGNKYYSDRAFQMCTL